MTTDVITKKVAKGAGVNFIGMIFKVLGGPVLFILLTRMYGDAPMGLFLIAYNIVEVVGGLAISGFTDSAVMYSSRFIHNEEQSDLLYSYLRKIIFYAILTGFSLLIILFIGAPFLNKVYYSKYPELAKILQIMAFVLPFEGLTRLFVAIPKAKINMKADALILGGVAPLLTMILSVMFYFLSFSAKGIAASFAISYALTLVLSLVYLRKIIDIKKLIKGNFNKLSTSGIISFVIPQNLNMALSRFISSMDVLMLTFFNFSPSQIAFYALGAQIVRNVRQVKLIFSGSTAPVIARYFHENKLEELNILYTRVTNWIIRLAIPILFIVALYRHELLLLFNSNFTAQPNFMLILLVNPFLSCAVGLTANSIVMSGFSKWNLINSLTTGVLNFILNLILIPKYGLMGAAVATAISGTLVSVMQVVEARILIGIKIPFKVLAFWIFIGVLAFLWLFFLPKNTSFTAKTFFVLCSSGIYFIIFKINRTKKYEI